MSAPGSLVQRALIATGSALQKGWSRLSALLVGQVASYGPEYCWLTDEKHAEHIVQRNGKNPHPGSVARVRRRLIDEGLIKGKRIFAGQVICKSARAPSAHGVVRCAVNWDRLGIHDPMRGPGARHQAAEARPKHIASVQPHAVNAALANEFEAMAREATTVQDRRTSVRDQAEDQAMYESVKRTRPPH
jgi:hypothetical protein